MKQDLLLENRHNGETVDADRAPAVDNNGHVKKSQLRKILHIAKAIRQGNLSARFSTEGAGVPGSPGLRETSHSPQAGVWRGSRAP